MAEKKSHIADIILSAGFLFFLLIPLLGGLLPLPDLYEIGENRNLAPFPEINPEYLDPLPTQLDRWYGDHFYGRAPLLEAYTNWNNELSVGNIATKMVVIGKENWVFGEGTAINQYKGIDTFSREELIQVRRIQTARAEWLLKKDIAYYVVIVPNKHTIYPEFLPENIRKIGPTSQIEQVKELFEHDTLIHFLDLREELFAHKKEHDLYLFGDTHWNDIGAFYGYQKIMEILTRDFPSLGAHTVSRDSLNLQYYRNFRGNLVNIARLGEMYEHDMPMLKPGFVSRVDTGRIQTRLLPSVYPQYRAYPEIFHSGDENLPKALIIRDSFTRSMIPWLSEHFSTTVFLWDGWRYLIHKDIVEAEKPDIVMVIMLEEYLGRMVEDGEFP